MLRHDSGGFTIEECKLLKITPSLEKDCVPVTNEEKVVHYADHLIFLMRLNLDPLNDPQASVKPCFPLLRHHFMTRANIRLEIDSPVVKREVQINNEMKRYYQALVEKE